MLMDLYLCVCILKLIQSEFLDFLSPFAFSHSHSPYSSFFPLVLNVYLLCHHLIILPEDKPEEREKKPDQGHW